MAKKINKEMVIEGLKYLAENQDASREEINSGLKDRGWDIPWEDFYRQFPLVKLLKLKFFKEFKKGRTWAGANILINLATDDSGFAWGYIYDQFLSVDDEMSVYQFIRMTGDRYYTKASLSI